MIKKLLILSGILIVIGGVGTIITMIKSNSNKEIVSIPAMTNPDTSSLLEKLQIQYTNSNGKTFDETFTIETTEDSIHIREKRKSNIQFFNSPFSSDLTIKGTTEEVKNITIDLVSANLTVSDLKAYDLQFSSVGGDIELTNVDANSIYLEATSGDIELLDTVGELELSTVSGDIELENDKLTHTIIGSSVSGDILLSLAEEPTDINFKGETVSGDVSFFNDNATRIETGKGLLNVQLDTVSGDITVE